MESASETCQSFHIPSEYPPPPPARAVASGPARTYGAGRTPDEADRRLPAALDSGARHILTQGEVAIKSIAVPASNMGLIQREVSVMKTLDHPFSVSLFDIPEDVSPEADHRWIPA
jgi:hypothetical protein